MEEDKMSKENKEIKGKGWFEDKNPLTDKAPIHQKVSRKKEFEKQGFTGATAIVPHAELQDRSDEINKDTVTLNFNVPEEEFPEFVKLSKEFAEQTGVDVRVEPESDNAVVRIAVESIEDFVDFLADKGIELDDDETVQIDEIIGKDNAKTDKEVSDREDVEELK
jgi:hypothetical protein